jgi:hypothetical protein
VYRRVSILSQGNKIPLRRVRNQRRVAARRRVCDSEARALALSQLLIGNTGIRTVSSHGEVLGLPKGRCRTIVMTNHRATYRRR